MAKLLSGSGQSTEQSATVGSDAITHYRAKVEATLEAEVRDSARVAELLRTASPWSAWPEALRLALMAAVTEEGDGMEAQKARWLRGQLFRDDDPGWPSVLPSTLPPVERGLAERLREDLLGRTALGCGKYLLSK